MENIPKLPTNRYEVEQLIKTLAGGASPDHGQALKFDKQTGWKFSTSGFILILSDNTELDAQKLKFQNGLFLVEEDVGEAGLVNVTLNGSTGGSISGSVTLDYLEGATQSRTATGDITAFNKPTNLPLYSPMIVVINLQALYDLQVTITDFHANQYTFESPIDYVTLTIVNVGLADPVMIGAEVEAAS